MEKNRQIKFRAWDGKAYRENFVIHQYNGKAMIDIGGSGTILQFQNDWIVEQYTGIKDKNGVEIYEGDIILYYAGHKKEFCEVKWIGDMITIAWSTQGLNTLINGCKMSFEVVGNIHEKLDLLGENEKDE